MENQTVPNPALVPVVPQIPASPAKPRRSVVIPVLLVILSTLVGACTYLFYQNTQLEKSLASYQTTVTTPTPIVSPEPVAEAEDPTGNWKTYTNNKSGTFTTSDWNDYSFSKEIINYQLQYPSDWNLDGSVFEDKNGNKVAEFLPGAIVLSNNQKCFDNYNFTDRMRLISKENMVLNEFKGSHLVTEVQTEPPGPGIWYPNIYCLQMNDKAFVMAFYEYTKIPKNGTLFNQILSTFKFTN
jgi:hypothetical protein